MNRLEAFGVTFIPGQLIRQQRGDDRLGVGPPVLHIVTRLLWRAVVQISKRIETSVLFIPAPLPHPVEHLHPQRHQIGIAASMLRLVQDEPRRLDGVPWIQQATIEAVDDFTGGGYRFHHDSQIRLAEVVLDLLDAAIDPGVHRCITDVVP